MDDKKKHDHPRSKPTLFGTNVARVAGGDADMSQSTTVFSPFLLLMCLFLFLSLSLIDKDKANL